MSRRISLGMVVILAIPTLVQPSFAQSPEMIHAILHDLDLTPADFVKFQAALDGRMQEMRGKLESRFREPPTLQNYREKVGAAIDEIGPSITEIVRGELRNALTADQYQKLETRILQIHTSMLRNGETSERPDAVIANMPVGIAQMAMGPAGVLEFTEDQKQRFFELQKRSIIDVVGAMLELQQQFPNGGNTPEFMPAAIGKFRPILLRFKREYERILTDKQKAKIEELMGRMPDYMRGMIPGHRGSEGAWRPGAGSWVPGMGVPTDGNDNIRETPRERPRSSGGRAFRDQ